MARDLSRWVVLTLLAGVGMLVLRSGMSDRGSSWLFPPRQLLTPARERALALAEDWRAAALRLRLHRYRSTVGAALAQRARAEEPSVTFLLEADSVTRASYTHVLDFGLADAWKGMGLGVTKVSVGLVMITSEQLRTEARGDPVSLRNLSSFLLPDSLDRRVCVRMVEVQATYLASVLKQGLLAPMLQGSLGPCAFYARFGAPGPRVRRWLDARGHDVALLPSWNRTPGGGQPFEIQPEQQAWIAHLLREGPWISVYALPFETIRCALGRVEACLARIRRGDSDSPNPIVPGRAAERWDLRQQQLIGADQLLARVLATAGPERFADFWTTTLPVDSALTLALGEPVGEWTARWQRNQVPFLRVGPAPRLASVLMGLLVSGVAVGTAMAIGRRREVR